MAQNPASAASVLIDLTQTQETDSTTTEPPVQPPAPGLLFFPQGPASQAQTQPPAPGAPVPGPRIGSSDSDSAGTDTPADVSYSLLDDMRQAQSAAAGPKESIRLYGFPSFLAVNLRRVLARSRWGRGDWSMALSCLLWQGLVRYQGLQAVRDLSTALQALDVDDELGALAGEQVEQWRRGFKFSISDPTHGLGLEKSRNWKAPDYVHTELHDMAGRLGIYPSSLGIVAVMVALEGQVGVLDEHRGYMVGTIAELDTMLVERGRRLRKLIRSIEAGVW